MQNLSDQRGDARSGLADFELCHRIAAEFREMPGLRVTASQATRLFSVDAGRCEQLLEMLVREGVLVAERGMFRAFGTGRRYA